MLEQWDDKKMQMMISPSCQWVLKSQLKIMQKVFKQISRSNCTFTLAYKTYGPENFRTNEDFYVNRHFPLINKGTEGGMEGIVSV